MHVQGDQKTKQVLQLQSSSNDMEECSIGLDAKAGGVEQPLGPLEGSAVRRPCSNTSPTALAHPPLLLDQVRALPLLSSLDGCYISCSVFFCMLGLCSHCWSVYHWTMLTWSTYAVSLNCVMRST